MMELRIYPAPVLRKHSSPLRQISEKEIDRLKAMLKLMYERQGVGLAAPQVGWNARVFIMDVDGRMKGERVFINPVILEADSPVEEEEGCLSLPGLRCAVARPGRLVVAAYNLKGQRVELEIEGLAARAWQHEMDHLNGVLFIDRVSAADRMSIRGRLKDMQLQFDEDAD